MKPVYSKIVFETADSSYSSVVEQMWLGAAHEAIEAIFFRQPYPIAIMTYDEIAIKLEKSG